MALIVYNITGSPVTLAGVAITVPASPNPPERGEGFNVSSELKGLTYQQYVALEAQRPGKLEYHWSGEPEFDVSVLTIVVPGGDLPDIPTDQQKAALVGTAGIASGSNRYVTNSDPRLVAPPYLLTANEKAALQGTYSVASAVNPYVTSDDPRVPTQDENDALAGTSGPPSQWNLFVTSFDPRLENARVPLSHKGTHEQGQPDAILSLPTNSQKAALAGTNGTPAAGNPFVTNSDPRNTNARTPTTHASSHMGGADSISTLPTAAQKSALSGSDGNPGILNPFVTDSDPRLAESPLLPTEDQKAALAGADGKTPNAGNPYVTSYDSHLPTTNEKDALAGTAGTPSVTNKLVTNSDSRNSNARTPTGTAGGSLSGTYPNPGVANGVLTPANDAVADAAGLSGLQVLRKSFVAGAGGSPDDVAIYTADAPFAFRVLDALLLVSTAVLTATVTLRDTAAGGGNALSDDLDAATTGCKRNASLVATGAVAVGGTLVLRRSDSGVAGEVVLYLRKE